MDSNETWGQFFDVSDVLSSTLDPATGTLTIQLGDVTKDRADSNKAEVWQGASGVCSRPALPTQGKASCQCLHLKRSDHDMGFAYRDLRATGIYANLAPGDTCVYATSGAALAICKAETGSSRQQTTDDNTATGNVIFAGVSSYYMGLDQQPHLGGEWRYYAPWGGQWHDPLGWHLRHWTGAKIDVGGTDISVSGLTAGGSSMTFTADLMRISGAQVSIGRGVGDSVVQVTPLSVIMATVATSLTTVQTQLAAAAAGLVAGASGLPGAPTPATLATGNGTAATALAAAATALTAAIAALGTILTTTGTKSLSAA